MLIDFIYYYPFFKLDLIFFCRYPKNVTNGRKAKEVIINTFLNLKTRLFIIVIGQVNTFCNGIFKMFDFKIYYNF